MATSLVVNIMTEVDRNNYSKEGGLPEDGSDAVTALQAYAKKHPYDFFRNLSAAVNMRLFNYEKKVITSMPTKTVGLKRK